MSVPPMINAIVFSQSSLKTYDIVVLMYMLVKMQGKELKGQRAFLMDIQLFSCSTLTLRAK